jgi:hypothetical protein
MFQLLIINDQTLCSELPYEDRELLAPFCELSTHLSKGNIKQTWPLNVQDQCLLIDSLSSGTRGSKLLLSHYSIHFIDNLHPEAEHPTSLT